MDLRQLRYFAVLSDELHFRRAAERLHITQAPLSLAIQALERELGSQLFLRTQRRVELTETGEALRADARAILDRVERSRETIRDLAGGKTGHLRIGFTPASSLLPFFPRLISAFRNSHPHVQVVLREQSSTDQLAALRVHEIDVGIVRNPPRHQVSDVSFAKLLTDPLVVAMHRGHRLGHRARIKIADLRDEAFIFYPRGAGVGIYEQVIALCATRGFAPDIVQEAKESSTPDRSRGYRPGRRDRAFGAAPYQRAQHCVQTSCRPRRDHGYPSCLASGGGECARRRFQPSGADHAGGLTR
jgi:DNA-binding transcriptional LysR family regulator